ncbi:DNA end-binding protein Ku [Amycolatopsis bartoniae]|uniref:Non-homologous end joining protein Ku n=1 Tax=Amycolatopsis bartoniae TaxID=941986 RepID=A0A8H9IXV4_9PSEU|nr:Ku protein [Amycolatopsis bartoniae]MBB2935941.1 DNA end-binding protein Ku [Amycolatopsis bartoniae]TVT00482.1 Ku protein [Amycolatopsis bartoniae]GHF62954.1 non-homologous end joining protein Ku [Amycolatopsis bartoniae]
MRTVWKGTIGFGSSAIPVKAYSATEDHSTGLHQLHSVDGGRIRLKRICEVDGAEIPQHEVGRGYELPGGDVVVLAEDELAELPLPTAHSIEICGFVPPGQLDPLYFLKSYYLEPEVPATKPYVLLSEALQQAERVAIVRVALRQRETLGALRVRGQVLMLDTLHWPDEVRTPDFPFLHDDIDIRTAQVRAAANIIENLSGNFEPAQYTDRYAAALQELIAAKVEDREVLSPTAAAQDAGVEQLLEALQETAQERTDEDQASSPAVKRAKAAAEKAAQSRAGARKAASKARNAPKSRR